jgi:hypothetical protein
MNCLHTYIVKVTPPLFVGFPFVGFLGTLQAAITRGRARARVTITPAHSISINPSPSQETVYLEISMQAIRERP